MSRGNIELSSPSQKNPLNCLVLQREFRVNFTLMRKSAKLFSVTLNLEFSSHSQKNPLKCLVSQTVNVEFSTHSQKNLLSHKKNLEFKQLRKGSVRCPLVSARYLRAVLLNFNISLTSLCLLSKAEFLVRCTGIVHDI